jgi:hypothetical protein
MSDETARHISDDEVCGDCGDCGDTFEEHQHPLPS